MDRFLENMTHLALPLLTAGAATLLIQLAARRYTVLPRSAGDGIFLLLLPITCGTFGLTLPPWGAAAWTLAGLVRLLWSLRRSHFNRA
jgi:hypothetical protein